MKLADPPGMSSKILSSGFSNIFKGKGHDRYLRLFLVLSKGFLWFGGNVKVFALPTGRQAYRIIVRLNKD
jgi:hypothetical protein